MSSPDARGALLVVACVCVGILAWAVGSATYEHFAGGARDRLRSQQGRFRNMELELHPENEAHRELADEEYAALLDEATRGAARVFENDVGHWAREELLAASKRAYGRILGGRRGRMWAWFYCQDMANWISAFLEEHGD